MSKPLSNRLDKLEAEALQSMPVSHNVHIFRPIINPDGTVHEVLETIIRNGEVIRDDCGRPKGVSLAKADPQEHCNSDD